MITPTPSPTTPPPPTTVPQSWAHGDITTVSAHSGSKVWATNVTGDYLDWEADCLVLDETIPASGATWRYWIRWEIEGDCDCDYELVRVCDTGSSADIACTTLDTNGFNNSQGSRSWHEESWDLAPWAGATKRLEICMTADDGQTFDGIAVDDMSVWAN